MLSILVFLIHIVYTTEIAELAVCTVCDVCFCEMRISQSYFCSLTNGVLSDSFVAFVLLLHVEIALCFADLCFIYRT